MGLCVAATIGGLAAASGGFFPVVSGAASLLLLCLVAVGIVLRGCAALGRAEALMLTSFAAFTVWTGLSALWSLDPAQSMLDAQRGVLYLVSLAAPLLLARRGSAGAILAGVTAACVGVAVVAIARTGQGVALSEPLGYANALGLLAVIGVILAAGFITGAATRVGRAAATVAILPLVGTAWLSSSAGALAALAVGIAVAGAVARRPRALVAAAACCVLLATGMTAGFDRDSIQPRARYWAVAVNAAGQAPFVGHGAGSFARTWLRQRPAGRPSRNAHSLYVETLDELGAIGLVLLLVALSAPLAAVARAPAEPLTAAAAGAYAAFLVHAGLDWDWEMPVLVVAALCCGAALLLAARGGELGTRPRGAPNAAAVAGVVALGVFAFAGLVGNVATARTSDAAARGAVEEARVHAREATRWAPWSAAPWSIVGEAALARGDRALARASFRRGLARDPNSWRLWAGLAGASSGAERAAATRRARALNPRGRPSAVLAR